MGGAVILLQTDDPGAAVLLFKIQDVFDGGTAEAVNALVIVTDNTEIFVAPGQQAGQKILQMVGVLVMRPCTMAVLVDAQHVWHRINLRRRGQMMRMIAI